jgi:hypothetical protein
MHSLIEQQFKSRIFNYNMRIIKTTNVCACVCVCVEFSFLLLLKQKNKHIYIHT